MPKKIYDMERLETLLNNNRHKKFQTGLLITKF